MANDKPTMPVGSTELNPIGPTAPANNGEGASNGDHASGFPSRTLMFEKRCLYVGNLLQMCNEMMLQSPTQALKMYG